MSQDIVADALGQIMNAKKSNKDSVTISRTSKLLFSLFDIMKERGYIDFDKKENSVEVKFLKLNECKAIKPRYYIKSDGLDKYLRRYLPSRNFGFLIVSTSKGLMDQSQADEAKIGGSLIAYFY